MAPDVEAKLYYSTMVQDESRHTEAWLKLVTEAGGTAERDPHLDKLAHTTLEADTLEEKVFLMQVFYERLIISRFRLIARSARGTVLEELCGRLATDDGIHHGAGMAYERVLLQNLSKKMNQKLVDAPTVCCPSSPRTPCGGRGSVRGSGARWSRATSSVSARTSSSASDSRVARPRRQRRPADHALERRERDADGRGRPRSSAAGGSQTGGRRAGARRLATVLVGDDPASDVYIRLKHKASDAAGIAAVDYRLPADTTEDELVELVAKLNGDDSVDGILVQTPLPEQIDEARIMRAIDPMKDVDGLHPFSAGQLYLGCQTLVPATPLGVMNLLDEYRIPIAGSRAVVVGRSSLVGKPMALLLLQANATVTICHSRTEDLARHTLDAEFSWPQSAFPMSSPRTWSSRERRLSTSGSRARRQGSWGTSRRTWPRWPPSSRRSGRVGPMTIAPCSGTQCGPRATGADSLRSPSSELNSGPLYQ